MNDITKPQPQALAWNGKPVRNTAQQVLSILRPMLALFPQMPVEEETLAVYIDMLRDIPPDKLAASVRRCMSECKFLPTVADIRERYDELRQPMPQPMQPDDRPALNYDAQLCRETPQERMERIKRIERRERTYGH